MKQVVILYHSSRIQNVSSPQSQQIDSFEARISEYEEEIASISEHVLYTIKKLYPDKTKHLDFESKLEPHLQYYYFLPKLGENNDSKCDIYISDKGITANRASPSKYDMVKYLDSISGSDERKQYLSEVITGAFVNYIFTNSEEGHHVFTVVMDALFPVGDPPEDMLG